MTPDRRKQVVARWRIVKAHLDKMGIRFELDMLGANQISVIVVSAQDLNDLIEWGFTLWDDVLACYQARDAECRYFTIVFRPEKTASFEPDAGEAPDV